MATRSHADSLGINAQNAERLLGLARQRSAFFIGRAPPENGEHVEEHGITLDQFEAIACNPFRFEKSRSSGRRATFGYGDDGRKSVCVYEMIHKATVLPVTAYEVQLRRENINESCAEI